MANYDFFTVDVFTSERFGGNPLAVFPRASGLDTATMQALAAEMNYSETTFVLPPSDPTNSAQVRIFNRSEEMPFAGHPNVGTAYVLARGSVGGAKTFRFEELAGLVEVRVTAGSGGVNGAEIDAPQPLTIKESLPVKEVARCLSLDADQVSISEHAPVVASVGIDFALVAVNPAALATASPDVASFRALSRSLPHLGGRLSIFAYATDGLGVRARMFAPLSGTWEDPATGSANATLAALRLSLSGKDELSYEAVQGVEIGRRSELSLRAWKTSAGYRAAVGGRCVPMFRGDIEI